MNGLSILETEEESILRSFRNIQWPRPLAGLIGIKASHLPREISAGVTLAALIIPLNIGYAQVAGLPAVAGLYAAIVPLAIFALLTSSRHVVGSPDASMAALVGATLLGFAAPGDPMILQYGLALALMCGALFFVFWFFRLAFLANFLSRAVLAGFISGLGIEVFTSQVRKVIAAPHQASGSQLEALALQAHEAVSTSVPFKGFLVELVALVESIPQANLYSVAIGVGAFVTVRMMKRYLPRIPGALVALALLTTIVTVFGLDDKGVGVLGDIPSGLPTFTVPSIPAADYLKLLPGAFAIVAILMCEGLLLVRNYSTKYGYKADGNQVFFAFGVANTAASFSGALMLGNSPSRSAAMIDSGAGSQLPSLVAAVTIALVMLFFTDTLAYLPNAALAGIVANAVLSLVEVKELKHLWHLRRSEFWIAITCLASVLALGPLQAVIIAFLLSTIDVVRRASKPGTWVLQEAADGSHFTAVETDAAADTRELILYRFGAPLYFANAGLFLEEIEKLVTQSKGPVSWFVLDAEAMTDMDTTGADSFHEVIKLLADHGITFAISRPNLPLSRLLAHYGLTQYIEQERIYPTNRHAAAAYRRESDAKLELNRQ
ncbi:MAG: SulP family inorganic anion transporter [Halioglobus sp.]